MPTNIHHGVEEHPHACGEDHLIITSPLANRKHPHACGEDLALQCTKTQQIKC